MIHLPRERPSLLVEIFQPRCAVEVREAQDKEPVAAGTIYFAPPDYSRIDIHCRGDLSGHWDADRLAQVVSNIIGNALQHGRDGEPVRVRLDGTNPHAVTCEVVNAGAIDPAVLPRVFEPFRGGRRQAGRHDGLGLGLYIAQQIVHAHDGRIAVEVENDTHAVFSVTVPRRPADADWEPVTAASEWRVRRVRERSGSLATARRPAAAG